ncbi:hypothetical protein H5410_037438 [Solanum commersonii]|uniref:Uncharacterized protein n=1 Tax=Solanum commersonii TaxID=4109 RepID=A0A9J5YB80_SOLCO|nr:hypothetical protein H5410_037438 [Solanum commersonii]
MHVPSSPHQDAPPVCRRNSLSLSDCKPISEEEKSKKTKSRKRHDTIEPNVNQILPNKQSFDKDLRPWTLSMSKIGDRGKWAGDYASSIQIAHLTKVKQDCIWGEDIEVHAPTSYERVTFEKMDHSYVYTYPFTLGFGRPIIDQVIVTFVKIFRDGVINLVNRGERAILSSLDEDNDRGWMERFVVVTTKEIIPKINMPFPETWNYSRKYLIPNLPKGSSNFQTIDISLNSEEAEERAHIILTHKWPKGKEPITSEPFSKRGFQLHTKKQKKEKIWGEEEHVYGWGDVVYPNEQESMALKDDDEENNKQRKEKNSSVWGSSLIEVDQLFEEYCLAGLVDSITRPSFEPFSLESMTPSSTIVTTSSATLATVLTSEDLRKMIVDKKKMQTKIDQLKDQLAAFEKIKFSTEVNQLKKCFTDMEADLTSLGHETEACGQEVIQLRSELAELKKVLGPYLEVFTAYEKKESKLKKDLQANIKENYNSKTALAIAQAENLKHMETIEELRKSLSILRGKN